MYLSAQWAGSCAIVLLCAGLPAVVAINMSTGKVYPGLTSCIEVLEVWVWVWGWVCEYVCVCMHVNMCVCACM